MGWRLLRDFVIRDFPAFKGNRWTAWYCGRFYERVPRKIRCAGAAWEEAIELWVGYVLIEEASEALVVEGFGGRGEFDGEPRVGGVEEGLIRCGGAGEKELRGAEGGEWLGEREALVEEEADGEEFGAWVANGYVEEVGAGCVENQGGDGVVTGGEVGCDGGADTGSIGDDALC
jgi:hypothetical protein